MNEQKESKSSINQNQEGEQTTHLHEKEEKKEFRIELTNSTKLISYGCYLLAFILWVMISSIYLLVKISDALIVFDDISQNWKNNFILDVVEKQDGLSCDEYDNQSNFVQFNYQGSRHGCYCEDCDDDQSKEFSVSGLLHGKDLDEDPSTDDDDIQFRNLKEKSLKLDSTINQKIYDYSDFEESEFEDINDWKIIKRSCGDVDSLDDDDFFQDISFINPKKINYLLGQNEVEINLCVRRSDYSNFINSYHEIDKECLPNQVLCKGKDDSDQSYWFCIKENEKCPVRSLIIVLSSDVQSVEQQYEEEVKLSNGYSVLISRVQSDSMPISQIDLYESDGPCQSQEKFFRWRLSQDNLVFNPLYSGLQSFKCQVDTRYQKQNFQMSQKAFFDHSKILKDMIDANYPKFILPQDRVKYNLFYRKYITFNINCRSFFNEVYNLGALINKIEKMALSILITSSILSLFMTVDIVYIVFQVWNKSKEGQCQVYPWRNSNQALCFIYGIFKYPIALSLCVIDSILFYRMLTCREIGQDVINRNCTDEVTSKQFGFMRNHLSFYGIFLHIIICFCFWSADLHLINFARKYFLMKKKNMTPFDEFFSPPKSEKEEYESLNNFDQPNNLVQLKEENHLNQSNHLQINENGQNNFNLKDNKNELELIQIQVPNQKNNIVQQNHEQSYQNNMNNNFNYPQNLRSASMHEIGSQPPQLMTDLSKRVPDPIPLEKKKSSKGNNPQDKEQEGLINMEISETEENEEITNH